MQVIKYDLKHFFLIVVSFSILLSCNNRNQTKSISSADDNEKHISRLDISSTLNNDIVDTFTWNALAKQVKLIPIETNNQILLSDESTFPIFTDIDNDITIIADYKTQTIYNLNNAGEVISHFKHEGNGPSEYVYLTHVSYDKIDSVIRVFDNGNSKIITYDIEGNCLQSLSTKGLFFGNIEYIGNKRIIVKEASGSHQISIFDKDLNLLERKIPFDAPFSEKMKIALMLTANTTHNVNTYILNQINSDTVFTFSDTSGHPILILNKEKFRVPNSEVINFIKLKEESNDFIMIDFISYFSKYILIEYVYKGNLYAEIWDTEKEKIINKSLLMDVMKQEKVKGGFTYKFNNKIKIDIMPKYITERELVFIIPASHLLGEIPFLKEDDNPVVMILKLS